MQNHQSPFAPILSSYAPPKSYLLVVSTREDADKLEKLKDFGGERLSDKVFLVSLFYPPEQTLGWLKSKAEIKGSTCLIALGECFSV